MDTNDNLYNMKRIILLAGLLVISTVAFAQWETTTIDNEFDPKFTKASCFSKDKNAIFLMEKGELGVSLTLFTEFRGGEHVEISMILKIGGESKRYEFKGEASGRTPSYFILPQNGYLKDYPNIWTNDFLTDFKNASTLKLQIRDDYSSEIYEFNMSGSSKAFLSVSNQ